MRKLACITLAAAAGAAHAQTPALRNYCNATPEERAVADATAFMFQKATLIDNGNGTYRINATPFTSNGPGFPICTSEPLYGTPQAPNGRTAFLVGSGAFKAMVTAPHAPTAGFNPNNYAVIFGLHETLVGGVCQPPNYTSIPAANVYFPPSLSVIHNTFSSASPRPADYMLFQLDRDVAATRKPLALRRSGKPNLGDPLLVVGHYSQFPMQIATGATVEAITPLGLDIGTVPALPGSSGSAVYNLREKLVETVVASPAFGYVLRQKPGDTCYAFAPAPPSVHLINNGNLSELVASGALPAEEFIVSPTATVLHTGPVGGPFTNRTTQFTVTPRTSAGTASEHRIVSRGPATVDIAPGNTFTPTPGSAPQTFTVNLTADTVACGAYNVDLAIVNNNPSQDGQVVARIPHRLEVGLNDYDVSPRDAWAPSDLGPPFKQQRTLTIANPRATPVNVSVTSDQSWITFNNASSATLSLAAAGAAGSSGTVALTIADSIGGSFGAVVTRTAKIFVQSTQPSCDVRGPTVIDVTATAGVATRDVVVDAYLDGPAPGQTFGPPIEIPFDLNRPDPLTTSDYYVADVDLELGFYAAHGLGVPVADADTLIKIEVVSPDNTVAVVWDRNNASKGYFGTTTIPFGAGHVTLGTLKLDDAATPSLGPNPLSTLNGKAGEGTWKVRIYATTTNVIPQWVQLTVKRS